MWFAGVIVALMIVGWFMTNNPLELLRTVESLDEDLKHISQRLGNACNSLTYYTEYNPVTETGYVEFEEGRVCVGKQKKAWQSSKIIRRCTVVPCKVDTPVRVEFGGITSISIEKRETITIGTI